MPRLGGEDGRRVADIRARLRTIAEGEPPGYVALLEPLRELLRADMILTYRLRREEDRAAMVVGGVVGVADPPRFVRDMERWSRRAPVRFGLYNPMRPERDQRNRVVRLVDLGPLEVVRRAPINREFYPLLGFRDEDQMRVLVCDRAELLGWVGGFRRAPFTAHERRLLQALVPALRRRGVVEAHLRDGGLVAAALDAALEAIPAPAVLATGAGVVRMANAAARRALAEDRAGFTEALRDAVAGRGDRPAFEVSPVAAPGMPPHVLAIRVVEPDAGAPRVEAAARRYGLTPRQAEVFRHLVEGRPNRLIAAALGCAERTVEIHVSAILDKVGCDGRAELVARVWGGR